MASEVPRESGPVAKVSNAVNTGTHVLMPRQLRSHKSASFLAILEQGRAWRAGARSLSLGLAAVGVPARGMARDFLHADNLLPGGTVRNDELANWGDAVVVALQRCTRCVLGAWPRLADD